MPRALRRRARALSRAGSRFSRRRVRQRARSYGPARCIPQIVRKEPGSCPICGMALEPMTPTAEAENPELRDMTRRFWVGLALSVPLLVMVMAEHFAKPALDALIPPHLAVWVQLILATPVVLWGGWPFFRARLGVVRHAPPQHVHPDRARHRRRLRLQPGRRAGARDFPGLLPRTAWRGAALFRGGGRHRHARAARPGARIARPLGHQQRDPRPARSRAEDGARGSRRRTRSRISRSIR